MSKTNLLAWVEEVRGALLAEFGGRPWVMMLGSVDTEGRPRVRSVVCRRLGEEGTVWIASDARSGKNGQIRKRADVEVVCWLAGRREQVRILGRAEVMGVGGDETARREIWEGMSKPSRLMFYWPTPGEVRVGAEEFEREAVAEEAMPETFEVIVVWPTEVEILELAAHPHRRRRWVEERGWACEEVNP